MNQCAQCAPSAEQLWETATSGAGKGRNVHSGELEEVSCVLWISFLLVVLMLVFLYYTCLMFHFCISSFGFGWLLRLDGQTLQVSRCFQALAGKLVHHWEI